MKENKDLALMPFCSSKIALKLKNECYVLDGAAQVLKYNYKNYKNLCDERKI